MRRILLIGQPNTGKSTLLSALTSAFTWTSNYPGTTVEIARARALIESEVYEFIDTPGIYNLYPSSLEEETTEKIVLEEDYEAAVVLIDANAAERGLALVLSLAELDMPLVIAVNFWEEAEKKGLRIDRGRLERILDIPVVKINPVKGTGIDELKRRIKEARSPKINVEYDDHIEAALANALSCFENLETKLSKRGLAVRLLEGDPLVMKKYGCRSAEEAHKWAIEQGHDPYRNIEETRAGYAARIASSITRFLPAPRTRLSRLDLLMLRSPLIGGLAALSFISVMIVMTAVIGSILVDVLSQLTEPLFNSLNVLLSTKGLPGYLALSIVIALKAQYIAAVPYVFIFYVFLMFLEDSGFLARIMIWLHSLTKRIGIHSKAVIPILLGLGCSVPATKASRIVPGRKQRIIVISALAFIPCSSRAAIIFGVAGRFLGAWAALTIYALGFILAILVSKAFSKLIRAYEETILVEDVPPLRVPQIENALIKSWLRFKYFFLIVTPFIVFGAIIYALLDYYALAPIIVSPFKPLAAFLKIPPALLIPLFYGFLQKDLVISMLAAILGTLDFPSVLTNKQIMIFSMASTYQIPCIIALGAMCREIGAIKAILLWLILYLIGLTVAGLYAALF